MTDAADLFPAMLAPFEGVRSFHIAEWQDDGHHARWIPAHELGWLRWLMRSSLADFDLSLSAVPYAESGSRLQHGMGSVLFARTESGDSAGRLAKFKPRPTIVLQEGRTNRMVALWALSKGLFAEDVERANRRISYALNTKAMHCEPAFRFHPPGTVLRHGRSRPVVVHVAEQTDALYPVAMTSDAWRREQRFPLLKDRPKPDPEKWRR